MTCEQLLQAILTAINNMKTANDTKNASILLELEKINTKLGGS